MGVWDHGTELPRPDDVMPALLSASRVFEIVALFQQQFGLDDPVRIEPL